MNETPRLRVLCSFPTRSIFAQFLAFFVLVLCVLLLPLNRINAEVRLVLQLVILIPNVAGAALIRVRWVFIPTYFPLSSADGKETDGRKSAFAAVMLAACCACWSKNHAQIICLKRFIIWLFDFWGKEEPSSEKKTDRWSHRVWTNWFVLSGLLITKRRKWEYYWTIVRRERFIWNEFCLYIYI